MQERFARNKPNDLELDKDSRNDVYDRKQEIPSELGSHKPIRDGPDEVSQEFGGSKYQDMYCKTRASLKRKEKANYEERKIELNKFMMEMVMKSREKRKRKLERPTYSPAELRLREIQAKQNAQSSLRLNKRERSLRTTMLNYTKSEDLSRFVDDVKSINFLYVFDIFYAKVHSKTLWEFIAYLTRDNFSKVYFGKNNYLAKTIHPLVDKVYGTDDVDDIEPVMLDSAGRILLCKVKSESLRKGELRPGLHEIASKLYDNDVGLLLTDKPEHEALSKFQQYSNLDYVEPYDIPKESLVYAKDSLLPLPLHTSARTVLPKLLKLGMPVVNLLGGDSRVLKLTEDFTVCQAGVCVTDNAAEILKLLKIKMFPYLVRPLCRWSALTIIHDKKW